LTLLEHALEVVNDFNSRSRLEAMIARLDSLLIRLKNAKILHDFDNYQVALQDYACVSFMAGTAMPDYETKMNELKQFFEKTTKPDSNTPTEG